MQGTIVKVSGPLIVASGMAESKMYDVVRIGEQGLIGEIIELRGDRASIQVYEETAGIGPGEPVVSTEIPLSVELGPGLIESIFDGIQRPMDAIYHQIGDRIARGVHVDALNREKKWKFVPIAQVGQHVAAGDFLGKVDETAIVEHRIMAVSYTHLDVYKRQICRCAKWKWRPPSARPRPRCFRARRWASSRCCAQALAW